jgi:hypothetical protein
MPKSETSGVHVQIHIFDRQSAYKDDDDSDQFFPQGAVFRVILLRN